MKSNMSHTASQIFIKVAIQNSRSPPASRNLQFIVGRIATDPAYRDRFFTSPDEILKDQELTAHEMETLVLIADCPGCRVSSLMMSKLYQTYKEAACQG